MANYLFEITTRAKERVGRRGGVEKGTEEKTSLCRCRVELASEAYRMNAKIKTIFDYYFKQMTRRTFTTAYTHSFFCCSRRCCCCVFILYYFIAFEYRWKKERYYTGYTFHSILSVLAVWPDHIKLLRIKGVFSL